MWSCDQPGVPDLVMGFTTGWDGEAVLLTIERDAKLGLATRPMMGLFASKLNRSLFVFLIFSCKIVIESGERWFILELPG